LLLVPAATLVLLTSALRASAGPVTTTLNFDDTPAGTIVNTQYQSLGITFQGETAFSHDVEVWDAASASGPNSLDGTFGAIDVSFTSLFPDGITAFSIVSIGDPVFGSSGVSVKFLDSKGNTIGNSPTYDQTVTQTLSFTNLSGVKTVVLPADVYYDNLSFTAVQASAPEPGTLLEVGLGLTAIAGLAFKRR